MSLVPFGTQMDGSRSRAGLRLSWRDVGGVILRIASRSCFKSFASLFRAVRFAVVSLSGAKLYRIGPRLLRKSNGRSARSNQCVFATQMMLSGEIAFFA